MRRKVTRGHCVALANHWSTFNKVIGGTPPNKRLQLTPNSSFQSIRGTVLAAGIVLQRWRSALLDAAEPPLR
jgi:hypothetical protein